MTKRIFRSIMLVSAVCMVTGLAFLMGVLYHFFGNQLEKELKVLQKKIVNQKAKQDDRVTKTIQEYQEKKAYYEKHPLVVNYLYLQNEVNEILQTINQQMNNALK